LPRCASPGLCRAARCLSPWWLLFEDPTIRRSQGAADSCTCLPVIRCVVQIACTVLRTALALIIRRVPTPSSYHSRAFVQRPDDHASSGQISIVGSRWRPSRSTFLPGRGRQLRTGRKTATSGSADRAPKYRKGMLVTVSSDPLRPPRNFDAVIGKGRKKALGSSPRTR
jgi:hypothetical protein